MSSFVANHPPGSIAEQPAGGAGTDAIPIQPDPGAAVRISGQIRRSDGAALPGVALTIIDTKGRQAATARADSEGHYSAPVPEPGGYLLVGSRPPYQPAVTRIHAGDTGAHCDLVFSGPAGIIGHVLDADTRAPLPDAILTLIDERGTLTARAVTDGEGRYQLADLAAGTYTLTASCGEHDPVAESVTLPVDETLTHDVTLAIHTVLTGTVCSAVTGLALPESLLTVLDSHGGVAAHTRTDRDGAFRIDDLRADRYTIIAAGYPPTSVTHTTGLETHIPIQITLGVSGSEQR
jgi:hypothetical protein